MTTIRIPAAEAKQRLADYLARSAHRECRIIITRRGRPTAALVSIEDLEELEQLDKRQGLASVVGKWRQFNEIADDVAQARKKGGRSRHVSL